MTEDEKKHKRKEVVVKGGGKSSAKSSTTKMNASTKELFSTPTRRVAQLRKAETPGEMAKYSPKSLWKGIVTDPWTPASGPSKRTEILDKTNIENGGHVSAEDVLKKTAARYEERQRFIEKTCGSGGEYVGNYIGLASKLMAYENAELILKKDNMGSNVAREKAHDVWSKMEGMHRHLSMSSSSSPSNSGLHPVALERNQVLQENMSPLSSSVPTAGGHRDEAEILLMLGGHMGYGPPIRCLINRHLQNVGFVPSRARPPFGHGITGVSAMVAQPQLQVKMRKRRRSRSKKREETTLGRATCRCKKSACLKLYCECFAHNLMCHETCICKDCGNNVANTAKRQRVVARILRRNPQAFRPLVHASPSSGKPRLAYHRGCNCTKTRCLKKYCDCFNSNIRCSERCGCVNCANGRAGGGAFTSDTKASPQATTTDISTFSAQNMSHVPASRVARLPKASPIDTTRNGVLVRPFPVVANTVIGHGKSVHAKSSEYAAARTGLAVRSFARPLF